MSAKNQVTYLLQCSIAESAETMQWQTVKFATSIPLHQFKNEHKNRHEHIRISVCLLLMMFAHMCMCKVIAISPCFCRVCDTHSTGHWQCNHQLFNLWSWVLGDNMILYRINIKIMWTFDKFNLCCMQYIEVNHAWCGNWCEMLRRMEIISSFNNVLFDSCDGEIFK